MVSWVRPTFDVPRRNESLGQLCGSLLGDSEMGREVGGGRGPVGDAREREAMQRRDISKACASYLGLDRVDEAGREPENGGCDGPAVV